MDDGENEGTAHKKGGLGRTKEWMAKGEYLHQVTLPAGAVYLLCTTRNRPSIQIAVKEQYPCPRKVNKGGGFMVSSTGW